MAGKFPYSINAIFVDMLGLDDVHIAHVGTTDPTGTVDSKTDGNYVLGRRPDIIEGYLPGSAVVSGDRERIFRGRPKMIREIVGHPTFQRDYCFAVNAPYSYFDRALFLRKPFAASRGFGAETCVPIASTTLGMNPD